MKAWYIFENCVWKMIIENKINSWQNNSPATKYVTHSILSNRQSRESHQVFDVPEVKYLQEQLV